MSAVTICNLALAKLGDESITSLTENKKSAKLCLAMYDTLRKTLLRNYNWGFALSRAALITPLATAPAWGFDIAFALPSDCLKVISTDDAYISYKVESAKILCNESALNIIYVRDEDDTDSMPDDFKNALALLLAANLALPLIKDRNLHLDMQNLFQAAVKEVRSVDSQEKGKMEFFTDSWLDSRLGSGAGMGDRSYYWGL